MWTGWGRVEAHGSVTRYGIYPFPCRSLKSSGDRDQTVTSGVYDSQLTLAADLYHPRHGRTENMCGPTTLVSHTTSQPENSLSTLKSNIRRHPPYSPELPSNDLHLFTFVQYFQAENSFMMLSKRTLDFIIIYFTKT